MLPIISIIFLMADPPQNKTKQNKKKKLALQGVSYYHQKIIIGWRKYDFEIELHSIHLYFIICILS